MITPNISAYLCFRQLEEYKNIKRKGVITPRKQPRFDLTLMASYWSSLDKLKNYQGKIFFNLIATEQNQYRKQDGRASEYYLQVCPAKSKAINFSGLRFLYLNEKKPVIASGEPSDTKTLKGGIVNPMYENCKDGFLFLFSDDWQQLEILIITDGKDLVDAYRKQMAIGGLNQLLDGLRKQAKLITPL